MSEKLDEKARGEARRLLLEQDCDHMADCSAECFGEWVDSLARALSAARAEGFAEGRERAAQIADVCDKTHISRHAGHYAQGRCIAAAIRALEEKENA